MFLSLKLSARVYICHIKTSTQSTSADVYIFPFAKAGFIEKYRNQVFFWVKFDFIACYATRRYNCVQPTHIPKITIVNHANQNLHTSAKFNLINLRIRGASFDGVSCVESNHIRRRYSKPPEYSIDFDIHTSTARSQITTDCCQRRR